MTHRARRAALRARAARMAAPLVYTVTAVSLVGWMLYRARSRTANTFRSLKAHRLPSLRLTLEPRLRIKRSHTIRAGAC